MSNEDQKRSLEIESSQESSPEVNKRRKNTSNSFTQIQSHKSSIQYIHEIVQIQPIKFDMLAQEGQAHKPLFKFSLEIKLYDSNVSFYSSGNSKKQAKIIASLKAINYLIKVPNFFRPEEIEAFEYLVSIESKLHSIDKDVLEESVDQIETKIVKIESPKTPDFDLKTREIIATKNVLMILNHLLPKKVYTDNLIEESGASHSKIFKFEIRISKEEIKKNEVKLVFDVNGNILADKDSTLFQESNDELIFYGVGNTKKVAKSRAAQLLLETLFNINLSNPENDLALSDDHKEEMRSKFKDFADSLSDLINKKYNELVEQLSEENEFNPNKFLNVYSGIFQSNGIDVNTSKLICITTGTKCIGGEYMSMTGTSLNDCHAEILAVRVLRKYLLHKLNEFVSQNESDIFEINPELSPPYRLKSNVNFHLFISSAPCGDSRIFSISDNTSCESTDSHPNRKVRGLLRAKIESGMGTIPVRSYENLPTWDGILLGERLKVMSCSDKVCKYNIIGIQGALLSHFINPIYFDSVIIGGFYNRNHLARALFGRVAECESKIPDGYRVNKPILSSITNSLQRQTSKPSTKSLIWSDYMSQIEIINCKLGKKENGSHSELCKYELFKLWIDLVKNSGQNDEDLMNDLSYDKAKKMADKYQMAKFEFYKCLNDKNLGKWLTAPIEQDLFTL